MNARPARLFRRALLGLAYAAFACKLLIPVGYMAAPLAGGLPVQLCPGGLPPGLLAAISGQDDAYTHGMHHAPGGPEHGPSGDDCPLGALAGTPPLVAAPLFVAPVAQTTPVFANQRSASAATRLVPYRGRAPPALLS